MNQNAQFPIRVNAQVSIPNPEHAEWLKFRDSLMDEQGNPRDRTAFNEWSRENKQPAKHLYVREDCYCHGWFAEFDTDDGQTSSCVVGLIERSDGTMQTVWCDNVRLINPTVE